MTEIIQFAKSDYANGHQCVGKLPKPTKLEIGYNDVADGEL